MTRASLLLVFAGVASASEDGHALLRRGIALSREASFAASVAALEQARISNVLSTAEAADCGYWLATDYVALGSTQAARRELKQLVESAPGYELPPYTSPKVAALYRQVQEELERAPRLKALPPRRGGDGLALFFEPSRTGGTAYGAVYWRWQGEKDWREAALAHANGGENLTARLLLQRSGVLEYWAEVRAPDGAARAGSAEKPLRLPATVSATATAPPQKDSVARKWWLWTSVAAVTSVALGVGLYYGLRQPTTDTADAVLDFQVR